MPGQVVQDPAARTAAVATGTTTTPSDDSLPQQGTEGTEWANLAVAITPTAKMNRLDFLASVNLATSAAGQLTTALHQDATVNALAVAAQYAATTNAMYESVLRHRMLANTVSSTTFKLLTGNSNASTNTLNGSGGARLYGGGFFSNHEVKEIMA